MDNSTKVLQLKHARDGNTNISMDDVFTKDEQLLIEKFIPQLEGKTEKLKKPYPIGQLSRATWTIARLGGWKGYKSSRPAGMKTLKRGLDKFNERFIGWHLARDQ